MGGQARTQPAAARLSLLAEEEIWVTEAWSGRIYALVWRLCGNDAALAEDLVQEAFIRAWNKLELFEGKSAFGTWLHRLAANVALSDRRIRLKRVAREQPMDEAVERTAMGERDQRAGLKADLEQAIARLPERARTVLVLFDIEGYSHAEIAETTGMAPDGSDLGNVAGVHVDSSPENTIGTAGGGNIIAGIIGISAPAVGIGIDQYLPFRLSQFCIHGVAARFHLFATDCQFFEKNIQQSGFKHIIIRMFHGCLQ